MTPLASWALIVVIGIGAWCSAFIIEAAFRTRKPRSKPRPTTGRHRKVKNHG